MTAWLAVDGGQTGLRLRTSDGRNGTGPGFSYADGDPVASITAAVRTAAANAGVARPVGIACLGLTGYPARRADRDRLGVAVARALDATEVRLCEDMVTAHAGALPGGTGVALAAGTGVVCLAIGADGTTRKIDGGGHLLGDLGGGFATGQAGLRAVLAATDGRGPATALSGLAAARYGGGTDLGQRVAMADSPVSAVAAFAVDVFEAAADGDAVASAVVGASAANLARTAAAGVRALGCDAVRIACAGRLFDAGDLLMAPLRQRLAELAPSATLVPPAGDPLDGAVRLATTALGSYAPLVHVHRGDAAPAPEESVVDGLPFPAGSLLVSCQAQPSNPLHGPGPMARMAAAAAAGGACGIRANGAADVAAIRAEVALPVIGINKIAAPGGTFITPTFDAAAAVVRAGATMVAVDGTARPRPDGSTLADQIARIHDELGVLVMADVDSAAAGIAARGAGADVVASTLSGYTGGVIPEEPDVALVRELSALDCPVIAEGRYRTADDVRAAVAAGAYAVVVGTAITNPMDITTRLTKALR
ncbi:putative N-acetylmannosamine-6-phosphate 2-epimerase [Amycolatopsis sp. CA-230715]|uniref:putative N-acetylmannosamine-6-phosphate 2-epimerase n=1 Tax=Amycolatopsis sp. CA-230715 TaxID=2745196 RepID=UPI001C341888|nr:putative N-acetylmannosamine-6-phosphate 2-epimerase [Amycolatopsis sp. CA-230715]QWF83797.1 Putative N-acetylmannosamine-6-phosphate 2-epimerase [Amycolatopsis sp. CA-230715]